MPTTRKRRTHRRRSEPITPTGIAFLHDDPLPPGGDVWEDFSLRYNHFDSAAELWALAGDEVMTAWVREHPGTRPRCWWRFSAPRLTEQNPRQFWPYIEARRHVGGPGEVDDRPTCAEFGSPGFWHEEKTFSEPTMIESQAAYLRRHGLLAADERRRIPTTDFDPVPFKKSIE